MAKLRGSSGGLQSGTVNFRPAMSSEKQLRTLHKWKKQNYLKNEFNMNSEVFFKSPDRIFASFHYSTLEKAMILTVFFYI